MAGSAPSISHLDGLRGTTPASSAILSATDDDIALFAGELDQPTHVLGLGSAGGAGRGRGGISGAARFSTLRTPAGRHWMVPRCGNAWVGPPPTARRRTAGARSIRRAGQFAGIGEPNQHHLGGRGGSGLCTSSEPGRNRICQGTSARMPSLPASARGFARRAS